MAALALIQNAVLTVAAGVGAVVALLGLRTWRRQLRGRSEYDLARRLLRAVYQVRDDLEYARGRVIGGSELAAAAAEAGIDLSELEPGDRKAVDLARSRRLKRVDNSLSDLRVEELEAEVLWGAEATQALDALRGCIVTLNRAISEYASAFGEEDVPSERAERERFVELRRILYGSGGNEDTFAQSVSEAVKSVEAFVRPYLKL